MNRFCLAVCHWAMLLLFYRDDDTPIEREEHFPFNDNFQNTKKKKMMKIRPLLHMWACKYRIYLFLSLSLKHGIFIPIHIYVSILIVNRYILFHRRWRNAFIVESSLSFRCHWFGQNGHFVYTLWCVSVLQYVWRIYLYTSIFVQLRECCMKTKKRNRKIIYN